MRALVRGGLTIAGVGVLGLAVLATEGLLASRRTYLPADSAPAVTGEFGSARHDTLQLVLLGDSTAAGVGTHEPDDTVGAQLAQLVADRGHHVELSGVAVSGSRAADLGPQVSRALLLHPDLAVILIGANDATHLTGLDEVQRHLTDAVRRLREAGVPVVVGTCPDMGVADAFHEPLRSVVAWQGRRVAAASAAAVRSAGGAPVDIGAATGARMRAHRDATLSEDRFHPSAAGYRLWADALLPAVLEHVGVRLPQ